MKSPPPMPQLGAGQISASQSGSASQFAASQHGGALGGLPLGHPALADQRQQQMQAQLQAAMGQLSLGIYSQLAIAHFTQPRGPISHWTPADHQDELRTIAKNSQTAARAYFEEIMEQEQGDSE